MTEPNNLYQIKEIVENTILLKIRRFLYDDITGANGENLTDFVTVIDKISSYNSGLFFHEKTLTDFITFMGSKSEIEFQILDLIAKLEMNLNTANVDINNFIDQWVNSYQEKPLFISKQSLIPNEIKDNIATIYEDISKLLINNRWWAILYFINLFCDITTIKDIITDEVN